ncbi:hypothetical protein MOUN0_K05930 [Monosporozyma unispora]|nr:hypothetical protein C6P44_004460 [Kazachstania unispora]
MESKEDKEDNMDYIEKEHINVPQHLDKPWFREAYSAALRFHEKDKVLDARDRLDLCNTYKTITKAQAGAGWLGFLGVFSTPFIYKYYTTGAIKGVRVPRNFFLGMLGMLVSSHLASNIAYKRQLQILDPEGTLSRRNESSQDELLEDNPNQVKPRNERQFEMLTLLKNGGSPRWATYFYMTYLHPDRIFPDPELKLKQLQSGKEKMSVSPFMHQQDPMGLYTNKDINYWKNPKNYPESKDSNIDTLPTSINDLSSYWGHSKDHNNGEENQSSWDKVRNNFNKDTTVLKSQDEQNDDDLFNDYNSNNETLIASFPQETNSQQEFDKLLERERDH